ncbi:hypothetical protein KJ966_01135 [bacterium]|nr:hypothetical protein [bacterium]
MIKCTALKSLLLAVFLVSFCTVASTFAQTSDLLNQNSISDISISVSNNTPVLLFKGTINSLKTSDIKIVKDEGSRQFSLTFANSLWDTTEVGSINKEFDLEDPISSIRITNDMQGAAFIVVFEVDAKREYEPAVVSPISANEIQILLKQKEIEVRKVKPESIEQEMEVAVQKQEDLEQKKEQAQVKARESVEEILKHYRKPSMMQISILNASGYPKRAYNLSVYLGKLKKDFIEESLGMKMEIINISNAPTMNLKQSTIYFRSNFLKSALFLANLIKGDQKVIPIKVEEEMQGVDIEIYLGRDYK